MRVLMCWFALAVLGVASVSRGAEAPTFEFKQNYREGQAYNVMFSQSLDLHFEATYRGQVYNRARMTDAWQEKALVTVLETDGGLPVRQRIEVDKSSGRFYQFTGEIPKQEYMSLAGKTVLFEKSPVGYTTCKVDGEEVPGRPPELGLWLGRDEEVYPEHPVALKEKWDLSRRMGRVFSLARDQEVIAFARLKSVKVVYGHPIAELTLSVAVVGSLKNIPTIRIESQLEGPALVDLMTGRIARIDLGGETQAAGPMEVQVKGGGTASVNATGGGRIEFHQISVAAKSHKDLATADAK